MKYIDLPFTEKIYRAKAKNVKELFNNTQHADARLSTHYMGELFTNNNIERRESVYFDNTILRVVRTDLLRGEVDFKINKLHKNSSVVIDLLENDIIPYYINPRAVYRTYSYDILAMDLVFERSINL